MLTRSSLLAVLAWAPVAEVMAVDPIEVAIAFVGTPEGEAYQGALQGLAEANQQGRFLGQRYVLTAYEDTATALAAAPAAIVATPSKPDELKSLVETAGTLPVFNVTLTDAASRALCLPQLFHIQPSDAMKAAALEQWQQAGNTGEAKAVAWNSGFKKYAASQLNKRYSKAAGGAPMTDAAWAGWAAVKLYSDAVARQGGTAPEALLSYLHNDMAFDGQKGVEMTFRSNGQLKQVILIEQAGKVVAEAPIAGVVDSNDLDTLGGGDCPAK